MKKLYICIFIIVIAFGCKTKQPVASAVTVKVIKSSDSLDFKIGQMIMIGIGDFTALTTKDSMLKEIRNNRTGGILLFEKNISKTNSKENLKKLVADMQKEASVPLFISIDEEGGKVHRMKEKYGFVGMPSAAYLGRLDNLDSTAFYTKRLGTVMKECGINLNYAPLVDLALNPDNPVIAKTDRSYSADPVKVSRHAQASIRAFHEAGIKTIIKHFPGHGSSSEDSHLGIADVTNKWKFMELFPYKTILESGNYDAIMTAHIVNCHLDTACLPATLSKSVMTGILRDFMGYKGAIFSDDMQMYAISKNYGFESAIRLAILAGVDVLMFGNNVNPKDRITATEVHAIVKKLVTGGQVSPERIDESYRRILLLKNKKL
jgi:beta-N-acetylhexosaminidase